MANEVDIKLINELIKEGRVKFEERARRAEHADVTEEEDKAFKDLLDSFQGRVGENARVKDLWISEGESAECGSVLLRQFSNLLQEEVYELFEVLHDERHYDDGRGWCFIKEEVADIIILLMSFMERVCAGSVASALLDKLEIIERREKKNV